MKIAVVTGASSGIGREFARQISARYGKLDEIWLIARRKELLESLQEEIKLNARIIAMDLTSEEDMNQFKDYLEELNPDIKILVNCAGYGKVGRFEEIDLKEQTGMIDLNCKALTEMTGICLNTFLPTAELLMWRVRLLSAHSQDLTCMRQPKHMY